jgi:hypothetical protein
VDAREGRVARSEALFRLVNERIADLSLRHGIGNGLEFLCECGRRDCLEALSLTREEYKRVRAHSDRFIVALEHDFPEIEEVVERHDGYLVVRKAGGAERIADTTDPDS